MPIRHHTNFTKPGEVKKCPPSLAGKMRNPLCRKELAESNPIFKSSSKPIHTKIWDAALYIQRDGSIKRFWPSTKKPVPPRKVFNRHTPSSQAHFNYLYVFLLVIMF